MTRSFHLHLDRIGWTYELAYRIFFERSTPRTAAHLALAAFGGRGLHRTIAEHRADVVVTEYPVLSAALGQLRSLGRLKVPVCSSISDPAGLYYWAHPGIDMHLLCWPEALPEVERIAGPRRGAAIRPAVDPRVLSPPSRPAARAALCLPPDAPVAVVSGGGWGLGDLVGAAQTALAIAPDSIVLALAGRNPRTEAALHASLGRDPRARIIGFTDQMPEFLAAADVLIHTTGGTTALEARLVGCPLVNYGRGVAHVRAHARALAELGLAEWAPDRAALPAALHHALARPPPDPPDLDRLPEAADIIVQVARSANHRAAPASASAAGAGS